MMNENILSYIWQFQYFRNHSLQTTGGQPVSVLRTGYRNRHAGPDFTEAKVVIDGVQWAGSIEIHVRASDWLLHGHQHDAAYEGVVLHVVWQDDGLILRRDGTALPCLRLQPIVQEGILEKYALLSGAKDDIPCFRLFGEVDEIRKYAMLDRVLLERLDRKAGEIMQLYRSNRQDWGQTAYQWIGKHYGFKLNDPVFLRLTQSVPWKIVRQVRHNTGRLEALLFGVSGMVPLDNQDDYVRRMRREFGFLKAKYGIGDELISTHEWKFARLRPAGFPTVRLAQFAAMLSSEPHFFSLLLHTDSIEKVRALFTIRQSGYWTTHYTFGKSAGKPVPAMGKDAISLLIINAVVPLLVAYSKQKQLPQLLHKALGWLSALEAEDNHIIRQWAEMGMRVKTAADSQALIEWHNNYCAKKNCLECTVGAALVRGT